MLSERAIASGSTRPPLRPPTASARSERSASRSRGSRRLLAFICFLGLRFGGLAIPSHSFEHFLRQRSTRAGRAGKLPLYLLVHRRGLGRAHLQVRLRVEEAPGILQRKRKRLLPAGEFRLCSRDLFLRLWQGQFPRLESIGKKSSEIGALPIWIARGHRLPSCWRLRCASIRSRILRHARLRIARTF